MVDMVISCQISTAGGWLELNGGHYQLTSAAFAERQVPVRRQEAKSPYVEGTYITNSLRDNVTEQLEGDELFVDIEVEQPDRGRVIGKNGRLIRSLRVVVRAAAGRDGSTALVELVEDDEPQAAVADGAGETAADSEA